MGILIQVYTAPRCAGGYAVGPVAALRKGQLQEAIRGSQGVSLTLSREIADASGVAEGRWIRVMHTRRGTSEWIVTTVDDADGQGRDTVTVTSGPIRNLLALRGTVRTVNTVGVVTTSFTPGSQTPATLLSRYFSPNLAADGLDWIILGACEYADAIDIGTLAQATRGTLLDAIERATGYEFDFVALSGDTGYRLDLVRQRGAREAVPLLQVGRNLLSVRRTRDLLAGATVIEPRSTTGAPMGEVSFTVTSISAPSGGFYWVGVADPDATRPAVIREADQYVGLYLVPLDGGPRVISDSRTTPTPAVQVADISGLTIGTLVTLWTSTAGALPFEVSSPSGLASSRGRVVAPAEVNVSTTSRNYAVDAVLAGGLGAWSRYGANTATDVFDRNDPSDASGMTSGVVSSAVTSIPVTGFPADFLVRKGDPLFVAGTDAVTTTTTVVSGTGTATLAIVGTLPATIAGDTTLTWTRAGVLVGTAVTNGSQTAGASSLSLKSLPAATLLAISDTLTVSYPVTAGIYIAQAAGGGGAFTATIAPLNIDIVSGTVFTITEAQVRFTGVDGVVDNRTISYEATVGTTLVAGGDSLDFTAVDRPDDADWFFEYASGTITVGGSTGATYTLTSAPAWSTAGASTPNITPVIALALDPAIHTLIWKRGTTVLGTLQLGPAGATLGAASIPLLATGNGSTVPAGDKFSLPAFVAYSGANTFLDASGAGTLTTAAATPAGIGASVAVRVRRCPDFKSTEIGSNVLLRLRGSWGPASLINSDYEDFGLWSPVVRVRLPAGESAVVYSAAAGLTSWAAEASQTYRCGISLWDADTGEIITQVNGGTNQSHAFTPTLVGTSSYTHSTLSTTSVPATRTRRVRASLHFGGGRVSDQLGGFLFLRWFSIGIGGAPPVVAGAGSQPLLHRALDLLEQRSSSARYRAKLSAVSRYADDVDELLTIGGESRLRSSTLDFDVIVRTMRIVCSMTDPDDIELELAVLTPLLTTDGFQEALNG